MSYVKIGVAGPVGSGKTALIEALSRKMAKDYSIGVITNDIYTKEDAQFLAKNSVLPVERIIGVETGGCPHTAIREDASMNLEAVDEMMERFPDIELLFIESGGDNLSATFSPELVDATIFVIDVAEGDKIPRKGGPGITRSDLLVINKIDTVERKDDLLAVIAAYSEVYPDFDAIIPISARTGDGLEDLLTQMQRYAVEGPQLFPDGMTTDQPDQQVCVRHGPAFFPFGDGLPHHMESGGQLLLGEALGLPQGLQILCKHCVASFPGSFYQGNRRCGKQRRRTWPLSCRGVTSPVPRRTAPAWR